jgi:hypothetical protein
MGRQAEYVSLGKSAQRLAAAGHARGRCRALVHREHVFPQQPRSFLHRTRNALRVLGTNVCARPVFSHERSFTMFCLMYAITRKLSSSTAPALVSVAICAVLPALQKSSFPGLLAPSVFEPMAAAAVSVACLRLMARPTARSVALVVVVMVATAVTCESFVFIMCLISVYFARAVFSSRVEKAGLQQRLDHVTCIVDVLAVTGCAQSARACMQPNADPQFCRSCSGCSRLVWSPSGAAPAVCSAPLAASCMPCPCTLLRPQGHRLLLHGPHCRQTCYFLSRSYCIVAFFRPGSRSCSCLQPAPAPLCVPPYQRHQVPTTFAPIVRRLNFLSENMAPARWVSAPCAR